MIQIKELFTVTAGNKFDFGKMTRKSNGIAFVSRTSRNNGVVGYVEEIYGTRPFAAGLITVSLGGTYVLSSFVQPYLFYTAQNVAVLNPMKEMTLNEKLYYCQCIAKNRYRYSAFGREANRTLKNLYVPSLSEIPQSVLNIKSKDYCSICKSILDIKTELNTSQWKQFRYDTLFRIKKGKRITKLELLEGKTPFISAIDKNNGIREFVDVVAAHPGNTITVNYNGSVGEAFYQEHPYWASDDINVLYPKFKLNKYIAMFLITIIRHEKYRFNYGRKWHKERMDESHLKLPIKNDGSPDFDFMEKYIKSLPYSAGF